MGHMNRQKASQTVAMVILWTIAIAACVAVGVGIGAPVLAATSP